MSEDTKKIEVKQVETGITFGLDTFVCIFKDGEMVGIEKQNGTIQRWTTEPMKRGETLAILGLDKVAPAVK